LFDVVVMFGAAAFALWLQALRLSILPVVMAVILGPLFEQQLAVLTSSYHSVHAVLQRPIADVFALASAAMLGLRALRYLRRRASGVAEPMPS
jgi:putative tricarboxylic transport membrane protein